MCEGGKDGGEMAKGEADMSRGGLAAMGGWGEEGQHSVEEYMI